MTTRLTTQDELSQELKQQALHQGFNPVGIASIPGSKRLRLRTKALQRWLQAGHQADMDWMKAPRRKDIQQLLEGANSVLAVGLNYYVDAKTTPGCLSIARYGWGKDYHKIVEKRLKKIGSWLKKQRPESHWKICVDSSPLLEKAWAEEAGIGWIGKHSNLIHQKQGSWMVIGHLLSTEPLTADKPAETLCGTCEECLNACPTKAIKEPFVVDSRQCIAYHTIENRNPELPKEIQKAIGTWVAGCDICQDVCPWNQKPLQSTKDPELLPGEWITTLTKEQALEWDDEEWQLKLKNSALKRIKPWMWRRNASFIEPKKQTILKNTKKA